jgi:heat shock protein HslJ
VFAASNDRLDGGHHFDHSYGSANHRHATSWRTSDVHSTMNRLSLALLILLAACASPAPESTPPRITDGRWTMTDASFAMPGGVTPALEFRAGRVLAHSGCNRASGAYRDPGDKLVIDALMSTKMACGDALNQFEINYYRLLSASPAYRIDGGTLTLTTASDRARFKRDKTQ